MNKIIKTSLLFLLPSFLFAQGGIINNGAVLKVTNATAFRVENGDIINKNSGSIDNSGNIYLDGSFNQTTAATYTGSATSWLWFDGATNQNATGDAPLSIARLRVDNGNRLVLGNSVNVSTQVDLTNNGDIELGVHNLVLAPAATMTGYDANNYIITNNTGFLQREVGAGSVDFPVGNTSYNLATLSNAGIADNLQVRIFEQVLDQGTTGFAHTSGAVNRTWMISEETVGGSDVTMTLQWNTADELVPFDRTACGVAHHTSGTLWDNPSSFTPATSVGAAWSQTRSGFTSFSPFVVRDLSIDLPIELLVFNAIRTNENTVDLDWATASEINNQGFFVERMLEIESEFHDLGFVEGNGTTTNTSYYQFLDANSYTGVSYYRLRQVDFDGTISYSPIRAVAGRKSGQYSAGTTVFPNPVEDLLKVRFEELPKGITTASFQITDALGQVLYEFTAAIQSYQVVEIDQVKDLAPAAYTLSVKMDNGEQFLQKFIKVRY